METITNNSKETQKLGEDFAKEIKEGGMVCLSGDLGAGKTTFAQGLLKGLGCSGPFTSPTFTIVKEYKVESIKYKAYHMDCYRIKKEDMINLGWKEIIAEPKNIVIIEWAKRIKNIIPQKAIWIKFEWIDEEKRRITFN